MEQRYIPGTCSPQNILSSVFLFTGFGLLVYYLSIPARMVQYQYVVDWFIAW